MSARRHLGLGAAIAVVIGSTIGSGIFRSTAGIAESLPNAGAIYGVWIAGTVLSLCGAWTLAEIGAALPHAGGHYAYLREAWGRRTAFLYGWAELTLIRAASVGAISTAFAEYLLRALGVDPATNAGLVNAAAVGAIVSVGELNVLAAAWNSGFQVATTAAKSLGLLIVIGAALFLAPTAGASVVTAGSDLPAGAWAAALVSVLWAFDGWADLSKLGAEVRDPERTLPRALLIGTLAIGALYLLANAAYLHALTLQEAAASKLVAADVAQRALGPVGATLVSLTVVVSTLGALHGSVMTGPRVFAAVAEDAPPFGALAHLDEATGNPTRAIRLSALLGSMFVLLADFEGLADVFVLASLPFYALSVGAAFVLRRRPDWKPPYRAPGGDAMPALFAVAMVFLFISALFDPATQVPLLGVMAVLAVGWMLAPRLTAAT
jgi:amino acid transporter